MTNSLVVPSESTIIAVDPEKLHPQSLAQRLELHDRKKSNRSTHVERSLFGSAIESLFGKDSLFGALDKPLEENTQSPPDKQLA